MHNTGYQTGQPKLPSDINFDFQFTIHPIPHHANVGLNMTVGATTHSNANKVARK
jgi:hypothetical protein